MPTQHKRLNVLVEGWRGINHSFALVNQYQLLELLKDENFALHHRDVPFARREWSAAANPAGFTATQQARINALNESGASDVDRVYRISSPFISITPRDTRKTITFMITETGLSFEHFVAGPRVEIESFTRDDNRIQTSSAWSADRIADWGFPRDRIHVVPLGVDTASYAPLASAERQLCRGTLGVKDDEILFFSISAPFWNKGLDVVLRAFARLRKRRRNVRLLLKDQYDVYKRSGKDTLAVLAAQEPGLIDQDVVGAISFAQGNLSREILRLMYCAADAYVSCYRAEGFNLPVLEAIACGTPVIVTAGGATDDFCDQRIALQVPGLPGTRDDTETRLIGRYIEPRLDGVIDAMDAIVLGSIGLFDQRTAARAEIIERCSWSSAARAVATLLR